MALLGLLLIPLVIAAIAHWKFSATITWKEFLFQFAIQSALIGGSWYLTKHMALESEEHLHGRLMQKVHDSQKCCHCHNECAKRESVCRGTGKDRKCSTECTRHKEVCRHFRDYNWSLKTSVGSIEVEDCEPNENNVPSLWTAAVVGEPVTVKHSYQNYLKADSESLFVHKDFAKFKVPAFPDIYGLYKVNPVIGPAPSHWAQAIREINADFGKSKQLDVTVMVTSIQDPTFAQAVEAQWLYGPKNSLNVILGVQDSKITWARVVTISKVENLKIYLRDTLQGKSLSEDIPGILREAVATKFRRTPMSEFQYLLDAAEPEDGWIVALFILGILLSVGLSVLMHRN